MKFLTIFFTFFAFYSSDLLADNLQAELLKNETYKKFQGNLKDDKAFMEASKKVEEALDLQQALVEDPNARAKLYYEQKIAKEPCQHCPRYLDLVLAVNKIVEKVNVEDVKQNNEKLIQLSKLKFLYYVTRSTLEDGSVLCSRSSSLDLTKEIDLSKGSVRLAAESTLALPNITDVQYFTNGGKEVHYYYRGENEDVNTIIEVIAIQDEPTVIKYYKYESDQRLPDLGGNSTPYKAAENKDNYLLINPTIERENLILPKDIKIGKAGTLKQVSEEMNMRAETEASYNQQKGSIALESPKGQQYLVLESVNKNGGSRGFNTVINYDIPLQEESGLKISTSMENKFEKLSGTQSSSTSTKTITFGLTDHDSEHFKIKTVSDQLGLSSYSIENSYKAGQGKIGSEYQVDRLGNKQYGVHFSDQGVFKQTSVKYMNGANGERTVAASVGAAIDERTTLSTEISRSSINRTSISLNLERSMNSSDSMVVTVNGNDNQGYNVMYQYRRKF